VDRQQVLVMPLHAITYDYGEEGLRARRITQRDPEEGCQELPR